MRILLVDDHEVVRVGLRALIERRPGMEVVGEAATASEAVAQAEQLSPDVVVLDVRLPGSSGPDVCRQIKARDPRIRVIMLTSYADDDVLFDAIAAGADGYVLKQIGSDALLQALESVGRGENVLDPSVTERVFEKLRQAQRQERANCFAGLSKQDLHILARIAEGKTNAEIGTDLHLSEKTVRNYVSSILGKLGVSSRAQAAAYAARHRVEDYL